MKNAIKNAIQYMSPGYFQLKVYYSIYGLYGSYMEFAIFCNFFKLSNISYASSAVPLISHILAWPWVHFIYYVWIIINILFSCMWYTRFCCNSHCFLIICHMNFALSLGSLVSFFKMVGCLSTEEELEIPISLDDTKNADLETTQ
jgi:hypothetical protein